MPPERGPDDPTEWLERARSNLLRARERIQGVYLEDLCFDAQQAVEKSLKAYLIHSRVDYPYVHDIAALLSVLEGTGVTIPAEVSEAARLTRFAVAARYPGLDEPVTEEEHERAVAIAEATVAWVEDRLRRS